MWIRDEYRLSIGRHPRLTVLRSGRVAAAAVDPAARARVVSRVEAAEIVAEMVRDAERGDRSRLVELVAGIGHGALAGVGAGAAAGIDAVRTSALALLLQRAVDAGEILFVSGWGDGRGAGDAADGWAAGRAAGSALRRRGGEDRLLARLMRGQEQVAFAGARYRIVRAAAWGTAAGAAAAAGDHEVVGLEEARPLVKQMMLALPRSIDEQIAWEQALVLLTDLRPAVAAPAAVAAPGAAVGAILLLRLGARPGAAAAIEPARPPARPLTRARRPRSSFELILVDAVSGRPVAGAPLVVRTPDGAEHRVRTDGIGRVAIADVEPGLCEVTSVVDGARIERSFVADGTPAPSEPQPMRQQDARPEAGRSSGAGRGGRGGAGAHVVEAEVHRLRTGDTPGSIAEEHGVPWAAIAELNWGTSDPDALEERYCDTLGCTRRTADGRRLVFDDRDEPGIIVVPRPWTASLAAGRSHRIGVRPLRPLYIRLENEVGLRLPGAEYHVELADGSERRGRLGRSGIARLDGVPEGPFLVSYPDADDLLAKTLAASVRRALGEQIAGPLYHLLMRPPEVVSRAVAAYDEYFNDLTGAGLAADADQVVTDPDARRPLLALAALAGFRINGVESVSVAFGDDDGEGRDGDGGGGGGDGGDGGGDAPEADAA
jgi:hypothetical protein